MQKHERQVIEAAREEASHYGMTVSFDHAQHEKGNLLLSNGAGFIRRFRVPASPRNGDNVLRVVRQWVRRMVREHPCG